MALKANAAFYICLNCFHKCSYLLLASHMLTYNLFHSLIKKIFLLNFYFNMLLFLVFWIIIPTVEHGMLYGFLSHKVLAFAFLISLVTLLSMPLILLIYCFLETEAKHPFGYSPYIIFDSIWHKCALLFLVLGGLFFGVWGVFFGLVWFLFGGQGCCLLVFPD